MPKHDPALRAYWKGIWKLALDNMPGKLCVQEDGPIWAPRKEPMKLGDYIKGLAKGTVILDNGVPHTKQMVRREWLVGQQSALTRAMGFHNSRCRAGCLCHNRVRSGLNDGTCMKDAEKRQLLERLAGPEGKELALKILGRQ